MNLLMFCTFVTLSFRGLKCQFPWILLVFFANMFYVLLKTCDFYFKLGILHEFWVMFKEF